jgi:hypothetical protein
MPSEKATTAAILGRTLEQNQLSDIVFVSCYES